MASETDGAITQTRNSTHRRYYRRSESPAPWWPWGLLPLLGLVLLFLYGALRTAPAMQADVEQRVGDALTAAGVPVLGVDVDGQSVKVRATGTQKDLPFIHGVAAAARCDTWYGRLTCPIDVDVALAAPAVEVPIEAPAPAPVARFHNFEFQRGEDALTLRGEVPTQADRTRIVAAASEGDVRVIDQLSVSTDTATPAQPLAVDRALSVLQGFERGRVTWTDGVLRARGRVPTEAASNAVKAAFNALAAQPPLGGIDVQVTEQVDQCNQQLADALAQSTIRFRTSSAQIDSGNEALLSSLAQLVARCPGTLTIEGHTDSMGDAQANQRLSEGRANAVRNALIALEVDGGRLSTRGFGEEQPIADNSTPAGRAQNRRIVIRIDEID